MVIDTDNTTKFDVNGRFHKHKGPSLLHQTLAGINITEDEENGVYEIFVGEAIQLVFQNRMSDEGECEQHPWHTHGKKEIFNRNALFIFKFSNTNA